VQVRLEWLENWGSIADSKAEEPDGSIGKFQVAARTDGYGYPMSGQRRFRVNPRVV
jgi:hypothetical protein